ncbi:MAG: single-stranded DNA-binding protein [Myxococcales bacterium]|nr:single-stranded DNA-binding protein [Myxococcales bacterium]
MRGMNRIVLVGRLGRDPELRQGKGGGAFCTFSVATNRSRRDGDQWVEETDWHDVRVFGDDAERCVRRLRKGSVVAVDGAMVYDAWTDDAGHKRRTARVAASRVQFVADLKEGATPDPAPEREPPVDADLPY